MLIHRVHCRSHLGETNEIFQWFTSHVSVCFQTTDVSGDNLISPLHAGETKVLQQWCHNMFGSERRGMRWRYEPRKNIYQGNQLISTASAFEFHHHSDLVLFVTRWEGVPDTEFLELACQPA